MKIGDLVIFKECECLVEAIITVHDEDGNTVRKFVRFVPLSENMDIGEGPGKRADIDLYDPILSTIVHIPQLF